MYIPSRLSSCEPNSGAVGWPLNFYNIAVGRIDRTPTYWTLEVFRKTQSGHRGESEFAVIVVVDMIDTREYSDGRCARGCSHVWSRLTHRRVHKF
jgi:hypothetical protein